ncbi:hypothetical protein GCM10027085_49050 [Spirosoma aerophilum]
MGLPSSFSLSPLWQALEANQIGCLDYQLASGLPGKLTVTPVSGHYLVELDDAPHQQQLSQLSQRLQLATQAAGQGVWEVDMEKDRVVWDEALFALHGLSPQGEGWNFAGFLSTIHPDDRPGFLAKSQTEIQGTDLHVSNTYRTLHPDGQIRYIKTQGCLFRNQEGRPVRMLGVAWDVTENKLAEEALRESEQRFRQIADNIDEVFWIHSAEPFRMLYINPAYESVWQRTCQSIYDDPTSFMEGIVAEDKPVMQAFFADYQAGHEGQMDYQLERPDGSRRWLSVRSFMVRNDAGQITRHLGIVSDITSQKETEMVLRQALLREQALNQLKSQFVANASHEFRTPLATIQSSVELIKLYLAKPTATTPKAVQKHLGVIEAEIDQFNNLLQDMLMLSTIESGKVRCHRQWADLVALCQQVLTTYFSSPTDPRRAELQIQGTPVPAYLDPRLMGHVLINLLSNAFKFSSAAAPRVAVVFQPGQVVLSVIDSGIGIPARELSNLFESFFRASNADGIPGTGLGLVIARQFVELQGGQLSVESQEKKGTTFRLWLPIPAADEAQVREIQPLSGQ